MRRYRFVCAALAGLAVVAFSALPLDAKLEFSKLEKKGCTTCHVTAKSKELNDTGKYYKEHKKLPPAK